ncbi:bifunctional oligoribonuclease/PAP phosphatase NrnA [Spirochaetota bacterium]
MHPGFKQLKKYLNKYDKFIISTHESPDADGLGAEIAFSELLKILGKESIILNSDETPETLDFIDIDNEIKVATNDFKLPEDIEDYAHFVLDTHDFDNVGAPLQHLENRFKDHFVIDHHEGGEIKNNSLIKSDTSSACEIIFEVYDYFKKTINFKSGQAIYTGMLFDTGSFRYPKTTYKTYEIAAKCVKAGANPFNIFESIYENNSLSSFALRSLIVSTMEVLHGGKMIAMKLNTEMLEKSGALFEEGEPAINLPLTVKGVVASLLVKQNAGGPVKVSMRTKGDLDVAEIAMKNGGGGHKNAAGFKSKLSFDETYKIAIDNMNKLFG